MEDIPKKAMETPPVKITDKWYFRTYSLVVGFLCIGPFILPLAWFNPGYTLKKKVVVSVIIIVASLLLAALMASSVKNLIEYYRQIQQQLQQIR